jgi:hypothetical protein
MFNFNGVVEEDRPMLNANLLRSMTLPARRHERSAPPPATRFLFSRTSVCWVTESVRNSYNSSPSNESVLTNKLREKVRLTTLVVVVIDWAPRGRLMRGNVRDDLSFWAVDGLDPASHAFT